MERHKHLHHHSAHSRHSLTQPPLKGFNLKALLSFKYQILNPVDRCFHFRRLMVGRQLFYTTFTYTLLWDRTIAYCFEERKLRKALPQGGARTTSFALASWLHGCVSNIHLSPFYLAWWRLEYPRFTRGGAAFGGRRVCAKQWGVACRGSVRRCKQRPRLESAWLSKFQR